MLAQHVLPHGVARARVVQADAVAAPGRLQRREPGAAVVLEHARRPASGRSGVAREVGDVDCAEHGEVVVPTERDCCTSTDEVAALVRPGAVPDDVAEAPDLVDALGVDVAQDGVECVKIAVDV